MIVLPATSFRAMGTEVEILAYPELHLHLVDQVQARFLEVEEALSRFRPDSELSRLNRSAGSPFQASPLLRQVLSGALEAAARTGGLFDPTLLQAIEAAGYTRSFDRLEPGVPDPVEEAPGRYEKVELRDDGTVVLHAGARVDLGGYAKGWTVDACEKLLVGCESWVVNAGGDLLARGAGPTGEGWLVGIEDPFDRNRDIGVLLAQDCAIATTSRMRRRWTTQSGPAHHIIDPATGQPADTGLASVTVVAESSVEAEVLAKVLFLLGPDGGPGYAESLDGPGAVFIRDDGSDLWTARAQRMRVS
jgi:thiamine biosynthesis lipoprotein